jgi:hypothetical protein
MLNFGKKSRKVQKFVGINTKTPGSSTLAPFFDKNLSFFEQPLVKFPKKGKNCFNYDENFEI